MTDETTEVVAVSVRLPRDLWLRASMRTKMERTSLQEVGREAFERYVAANERPELPRDEG